MSDSAPDVAKALPELIAEGEKIKDEGGHVVRVDALLNGVHGRVKSAQMAVEQAIGNLLAELTGVLDAEDAGQFSLDPEELDDLHTHLTQAGFHLRGARRITKDMLGLTARELGELAGELGKLAEASRSTA